jgi:hypothetical protein
VKVAFHEAADFDCVLRAIDPERGTVYKPVQLKQLPSHQVNAEADLQRLIDQLKVKYRDPENLMVAIWINRDGNLIFEKLDFEGLNIEQLWFFGDAVSGELTLDGGQISDLLSGLRHSSKRVGLEPGGGIVRFKPLRPRGNEVSGCAARA